ncbi:hypothetical protein GB937_010227 [Aspergillus fischeri]|nr:hypothetical protein GB937_010227 [Aspergillus fischeri]
MSQIPKPARVSGASPPNRCRLGKPIPRGARVRAAGGGAVPVGVTSTIACWGCQRLCAAGGAQPKPCRLSGLRQIRQLASVQHEPHSPPHVLFLRQGFHKASGGPFRPRRASKVVISGAAEEHMVNRFRSPSTWAKGVVSSVDSSKIVIQPDLPSAHLSQNTALHGGEVVVDRN